MTNQTHKKPGVIESIKEFLVEASEASPITKEEIHKKLVARFPDRKAASMMTTVKQQVPNKLRHDGGLSVKKNKHGYWLSQHGWSAPSDSLLPLPQPPAQTIRIDSEVWQALQKLAVPFVEKTPNDVLRRLLGLSAT